MPDHVTEAPRRPVWVWGSRHGGSIYLQPALAVPPGVNVSAVQKEFYKCDVYMLLQMEDSFVAVLILHCVESTEKLAELDSKYLSQLEASGWQALVAAILKLASEHGAGRGCRSARPGPLPSSWPQSPKSSSRKSFGIAPVWRG